MIQLRSAIARAVPTALLAAGLIAGPARAGMLTPAGPAPLAAAPTEGPQVVPPVPAAPPTPDAVPQPVPAPDAAPQPVPAPGTTPGGEPEKGGKGEEEAPHGTPHPEPVEWDRRWFSLEMLYWKLRAGRIPALVTTGPPGAVPFLGGPGVSVLFPPANINPSMLGARATVGGWFDNRTNLGWEASAFATGSPRDASTFTANGFPDSMPIGRPFFNVLTGLPDALIVAAPGLQRGSVQIVQNAQIEGANLSLLANIKRWYRKRTDVEIGPAWYHFGESDDINQRSAIAPGNPGAGTRFLIHDHFDGDNQFYGAQLGARQRWQHDAFRVDLVGKVALGAMQETANVNGSTLVIDPAGAATVSPGGFLAVDSNSGTFQRTKFAAIPQLNVKAAWEFHRSWRVVMGYNFLYISDAYRPGNLMDSTINPTRVPLFGLPPAGPARPAFRNRGDELWVQGLSLGLEWAY